MPDVDQSMAGIASNAGMVGFSTTTAMPVLSPANLTSPDFDYDMFLREQDIEYLAEESPGSTHTLSDHSGHQQQHHTVVASNAPLLGSDGSSPGASPNSSPTALAPAAATSTAASGAHSLAKQRLERRGHTKSRRGCFNCKRRRIKCQEARPACGHCIKTGLKCEYPAAPAIVHQPQHQIPLFSLQDMRFFQHFLFQCYPHHPIGAENIWTHEIPCLSQKVSLLPTLPAFEALGPRLI